MNSENKPWTPGPWHVDPKHKSDIYDSKGNDLALAWDSDFNGVSEDEAIANARLIAAAPDLYDALQAVITAYTKYLDTAPPEKDIAPEWYVQGVDALSKANPKV